MTSLEGMLDTRGGAAVPGLAAGWDAELAGMLKASSEGAVRMDAVGAARRLARSLERGGADEAGEALDYVAGAVAEAVGGAGDGHVMGPMIHRLVVDVYSQPRNLGRLAPFLRTAYSKDIKTHDVGADVMIEAVRTILLYLYAGALLDGERSGLAHACYDTLARIASREGPARLAGLLSRPATREAILGSGSAVERLVYIYHMVSEKHEAVRRGDVGDLLYPYPGLASYVGVGRIRGALARLPPLAVHLAVLVTTDRLDDNHYEPGRDEGWMDWRIGCEARFVACEGHDPLNALDMMIRRRGQSPQDACWKGALLTGSFDQAVAEMVAWEALAGIPRARIVAVRGVTDTVRIDSGEASCAVAIHAARNHLPFLGDMLYSTISPVLQRHHDHVARRVRGEVLEAAARARRARRGGDLAIVVVDDSLGSVGELGAVESAMRARGAPDAVIAMRGGECRAHTRGRRAREAGRLCEAFADALASAQSA